MACSWHVKASWHVRGMSKHKASWHVIPYVAIGQNEQVKWLRRKLDYDHSTRLIRDVMSLKWGLNRYTPSLLQLNS